MQNSNQNDNSRNQHQNNVSRNQHQQVPRQPQYIDQNQNQNHYDYDQYQNFSGDQSIPSNHSGGIVRENTRQANNNDSDYFDIIARGAGYINKITITPQDGVNPSNGAPLAEIIRVQIGALRGHKDKLQKTYYWFTVAPSEVRNLMYKNRNAIENKDSKVVCSWVASLQDSQGFIYKDGKNAGKIGINHFGVLLAIKSLKIDGQVVYKKESSNSQ